MLFITGYAENSVLSDGRLEPGMAVLTKPFAVDVVAARIKEDDREPVRFTWGRQRRSSASGGRRPLTPTPFSEAASLLTATRAGGGQPECVYLVESGL